MMHAQPSAASEFINGVIERVLPPVPNLDPVLTAEAKRLEGSLAAFQRAAWHVVEPTTPYIHNWHIDAICEHLEAVSRREIRNLVINIPPRHEKSLNAAVFWPAWLWTTDPSTRWLFASYGQTLSVRDSVKCRRIIQSPWYRARWGHMYGLTTDQNVKTRFENDTTGYRIATSVDGTATGEGGDFIVVDDPHNVKEAGSELKREGVLHWWDEVMSTRLNDPERSCRVIVMQRVHERDLTGHVLAQGGYEHLCLPAEYDRTVQIETSLGFTDPRTEDGELLWPARYSRQALEQLKRDLGPHGTAGQLQQRPVPRSGGMFSRADFNGPVPSAPTRCRWVRYWDKAGTMDGGAYTVGVLGGYDDEADAFYVVDVVRGQWDAGQREQVIRQVAAGDERALGGVLNFEIVMEQEPGSGGKESAEATIKRLTGYRCKAHHPTGDKFVRADPLAGAAKNGQVWLVAGDWNEDYLRVMENAGPGATYLDDMDATSGAFNHLLLNRRQAVPSVAPGGGTKPSYWRSA